MLYRKTALLAAVFFFFAGVSSAAETDAGITAKLYAVNAADLDPGGHSGALRAIRSNLLPQAHISFNRSLELEGLLNLQYLYTDFLDSDQGSLKAHILKAALVYKTEHFFLRAGRQQHGKPDAFAPYYGTLPDYLFQEASSLDGVSFKAKAGVFEFSALAGEETAQRLASDRNRLVSAEARAKVFNPLEINAGGVYSFGDKAGFENNRLFVLSAGAALHFSERTKVSFYYAANAGGATPEGFAEKENYKGDAYLLKLKTGGDIEELAYTSHFMFLRTSGGEHFNTFYSPGGFFNLGRVFTGLNFINNYSSAPAYGPAGNASNITAYNLGGSLELGHLPFKFTADIFEIAHTKKTGEAALGAELDAALEYTGIARLSVRAGYSLFRKGAALTELPGNTGKSINMFFLAASYVF